MITQIEVSAMLSAGNTAPNGNNIVSLQTTYSVPFYLIQLMTMF